jgi:AcrR family transcriptional regulator
MASQDHPRTETRGHALPEEPARAFDGEFPDADHPKVRQLLEAAGRLFLELPYDAVSTDAIAREAKVSKATLYVYFSSKEKLFATLVCGRCTTIADHLWQRDQGDPSAEGVAAELRQIARNFIAMLASAETLALYRSIVSQSVRFPELGRLFYEAGPQQFKMRLSNFLEEANARGVLCVPDPAMGALQFIHLIAGEIPMTGLLGLETIVIAEHEATIESGIALFMAGYKAKPADEAGR